MATGIDHDADPRSLYEVLERLRLQNQTLKLEKEISGLEKELSYTQHQTSTPIRQPSVRFTLPSHAVEKIPIDESLQADPNRNITQRRKKLLLGEQPNRTKLNITVKPATYDGTGSWSDYCAHFEACAEINNWSEREKGLYLAVSLRGQAQGMFGELSSKTPEYSKLKTALQERFLPPNQTELYRVQLRERRQKASETLSEMAQDIRRLTNLAYPTAPKDVKETLAREQFLDSIYSCDLRIKTKQARPTSLNDAVRHAVELEAFYRADRKFDGPGKILSASTPVKADDRMKDRMKALEQSVQELQKEFRDWCKQKETKSQYRSNVNNYRPNQRRYFQNRNQTLTQNVSRQQPSSN